MAGKKRDTLIVIPGGNEPERTPVSLFVFADVDRDCSCKRRERRERSEREREAEKMVKQEESKGRSSREGQILLQLQSHISLQLLDTHNTFQH